MQRTVPRKTLRLFPEPEADTYSCARYPLGQSEIYENLSRKLVDRFKLGGNIRELLVIIPNDDLSFLKTMEEDSDLIGLPRAVEIRQKPYLAATTIIEKGNSHGTFDNCNKEGLLNFIDCYVRDNMDHKALALVHPSLVDFVCLLTRDTYDTEIIMLKAEKAGDKYTLIALPDIPSP